MEVFKPKDQNNLTELEQKHWPQIEAIHPKIGTKFAIRVKVGQIPHPMTEEHQIIYIEAFYGSRPLGKIFLKPGDTSEAVFTIDAQKSEKVKVFSFCNLHGLWGNEVEIFK
ncbi:MAG: Superoxide reductase [Candidatus Berkelbacteria bacterium]|nr:Superoxide reductase [Candidatus Berkelbacteria bacterium]